MVVREEEEAYHKAWSRDNHMQCVSCTTEGHCKFFRHNAFLSTSEALIHSSLPPIINIVSGQENLLRWQNSTGLFHDR